MVACPPIDSGRELLLVGRFRDRWRFRLARADLDVDLSWPGGLRPRQCEAEHAALEGRFGLAGIDLDRQRQRPVERSAWQLVQVPVGALGVIGLDHARNLALDGDGVLLDADLDVPSGHARDRGQDDDIVVRCVGIDRNQGTALVASARGPDRAELRWAELSLTNRSIACRMPTIDETGYLVAMVSITLCVTSVTSCDHLKLHGQ